MTSAYQLEAWIKAISHGDRDAMAGLYHATSSGAGDRESPWAGSSPSPGTYA